MSIPNNRCVRIVFPDNNVGTDGFLEIIIHDMADADAPDVPVSELGCLRLDWPNAILSYMGRYQVDLENLRHECRERYESVQSGLCTNCGKFIRGDLGWHVAHFLLDFGSALEVPGDLVHCMARHATGLITCVCLMWYRPRFGRLIWRDGLPHGLFPGRTGTLSCGQLYPRWSRMLCCSAVLECRWYTGIMFLLGLAPIPPSGAHIWLDSGHFLLFPTLHIGSPRINFAAGRWSLGFPRRFRGGVAVGNRPSSQPSTSCRRSPVSASVTAVTSESSTPAVAYPHGNGRRAASFPLDLSLPRFAAPEAWSEPRLARWVHEYETPASPAMLTSPSICLDLDTLSSDGSAGRGMSLLTPLVSLTCRLNPGQRSGTFW